MRCLLAHTAARLAAALLVLGLVAAGGAGSPARADDDDDEVDAGTDGDDDPDDDDDDPDDDSEDDSEDDEDDEDDEDPDAGAPGPGQEPRRDAGGEGEGLPGAGQVGALVDVDQRVLCSAALLTPDTLLTAAHCVAQDGVVRWPWGFFVGDDVTLGGEFVRVLDGAVHPAYDDFLHTADLAVLRIAGGGPRAGLPLDAVVPAEGAAVRAIGFGAGAVGPGARVAEVSEASDDSFRYQPGTCPGDSGGPVLVADPPRIAGVVSTGAAGCASARAVAVAAHAEWIRDAVDYLDPPACRSGDGQCGAGCRLGDADCPCRGGDGACDLCDGVDPDCAGACGADGQCAGECVAPDPDCRVLGEGAACTDDVQCASSVCHRGACREPCAPDGTGCPPWARCATGADQGVCLPSAGIGVRGGCAAADPGAPVRSPDLLPLASLASLLWLLARTRPRRRAALPLSPLENPCKESKGDPQ